MSIVTDRNVDAKHLLPEETAHIMLHHEASSVKPEGLHIMNQTLKTNYLC